MCNSLRVPLPTMDLRWKEPLKAGAAPAGGAAGPASGHLGQCAPGHPPGQGSLRLRMTGSSFRQCTLNRGFCTRWTGSHPEARHLPHANTPARSRSRFRKSAMPTRKAPIADAGGQQDPNWPLQHPGFFLGAGSLNRAILSPPQESHKGTGCRSFSATEESCAAPRQHTQAGRLRPRKVCA